ncbi:MAG: radical SAM protein [Candidatus Omnitrophica bacterium]|nr:radical SAM protein [Candidatus Omnitrophota bacterium]
MHKPVLLSTLSPYNREDVQLGLCYLKAYCVKHMPAALPRIPVFVKVFPAHFPAERAAEALLHRHPAILGFSCYVWNVTKIIAVARAIKRRDPFIKIIVGGPEVSVRSGLLLRQERAIDIVVRGEGEATLLELLQSIIGGRMPLSRVRGITYRASATRIRVNPERPALADLDSIPSPYLEGIIKGKKNDILPAETMRGCPYRCHYCYYHKDFPRLRFFSLKRIERELRCILAQDPAEVYLMDPTFNINRKRAKDILRIFKRHNRSSRLHVELKAELLDEEMVRLLKQANATFIEIGIQSTDRQTLRIANRKLGKGAFRKNIMRLNKEHLPYQLQMIDALPGHTYSKVKKSIDWLFMCKPSQVAIMKLMLLPGTFLRRYARRLGLQFDRHPPYYVRRSRTMTQEELKKIDGLRHAIFLLYDTGLLRESIFVIAKKLKIAFCDIFETWLQWESSFLGRVRKNRLQSRIAMTAIPRFVKYLCARNNKTDSYADMYPAVRNDLATYCVAELKRATGDHNVNSPVSQKKKNR